MENPIRDQSDNIFQGISLTNIWNFSLQHPINAVLIESIDSDARERANAGLNSINNRFFFTASEIEIFDSNNVNLLRTGISSIVVDNTITADNGNLFQAPNLGNVQFLTNGIISSERLDSYGVSAGNGSIEVQTFFITSGGINGNNNGNRLNDRRFDGDERIIRSYVYLFFNEDIYIDRIRIHESDSRLSALRALRVHLQGFQNSNRDTFLRDIYVSSKIFIGDLSSTDQFLEYNIGSLSRFPTARVLN